MVIAALLFGLATRLHAQVVSIGRVTVRLGDSGATTFAKLRADGYFVQFMADRDYLETKPAGSVSGSFTLRDSLVASVTAITGILKPSDESNIYRRALRTIQAPGQTCTTKTLDDWNAARARYEPYIETNCGPAYREVLAGGQKGQTATRWWASRSVVRCCRDNRSYALYGLRRPSVDGD